MAARAGMTRHVLRNSLRTLPLLLTLNASEAILALAGLGFLGFGVEPNAAAEWGYDLNRSVADVTSGIWWTAVAPGSAIVVLAVLGTTLQRVADRVAVLHHGRIVESGPTTRVLTAPQQDYTRQLVASVPVADPLRQSRRRADVRPGGLRGVDTILD